MPMPTPYLVEPRDIICDLDDTLVITTIRYHPPMWFCGQIITQALGPFSPHPTQIINRHHEIDVGMINRHGFNPDRFGMSWIATYHEFAAKLGQATRSAVEQRLQRAANRFLDGPHRTYPRVKRTLQVLRALGHTLHLVTLGDPPLQQRKVRETGLARYFASMAFVTQHKDDAIAAAANGNVHSVMVGDSKRSDMLPAIKLGIVPVLIDRYTWDYAEVPLEEGSYHQIDHFEELPNLLQRLDNGDNS